MANMKSVSLEALRKMSKKDLKVLLKETLAAKAQLHLLLKAGHSKKSDTYQKAKLQIARINTILNQVESDAN